MRQPENLIEEIKASKLRGRGGAGFPLWLKWDACRKAPGDCKFVVCNADEGDPSAYSDRFLLEQRPHSVLFGMIVAGYIAGAKAGILYIRAEYPDAMESIKRAIDELKTKNLVGKNILGSEFDFRLEIIKGAGAYICGEETALLASIEGRRPEVQIRPPYPADEGLFGKPTLVNNVETLPAFNRSS